MELLPCNPYCQSKPGPDSLQQAAEAFVAQWQHVERALTPIIGVRGVSAIYARALHMASIRHAVLRPLPDVPLTNADALAAHMHDDGRASVALDALLSGFGALLADLIGASLVGRLLGARHQTRNTSDPEVSR